MERSTMYRLEETHRPTETTEMLIELIQHGDLAGASEEQTAHHLDFLVAELSETDPERAQAWGEYIATKRYEKWEESSSSWQFLDTLALKSALDLYEIYQAPGALERLAVVTDVIVETSTAEMPESTLYENAVEILNAIKEPIYPESTELVLVLRQEQMYRLLLEAEEVLALNNFEGAADRLNQAYKAHALFSAAALNFSSVRDQAALTFEDSKKRLTYFQAMGWADESTIEATVPVWEVVAQQYKSADLPIRAAALHALADLRVKYPESRKYKRLAKRARTALAKPPVGTKNAKIPPLSVDETELLDLVCDDMWLKPSLHRDIDERVATIQWTHSSITDYAHFN